MYLILVNKEPKYKYKITFGKGKGSPALAKWIDSNPNLAKAGHVTKKDLYAEAYVKTKKYGIKIPLHVQ